MIIRIRTANGMHRLEVQEEETLLEVWERVKQCARISDDLNVKLRRDDDLFENLLRSSAMAKTIGQLAFRPGQLFYLESSFSGKEASTVISNPPPNDYSPSSPACDTNISTTYINHVNIFSTIRRLVSS